MKTIIPGTVSPEYLAAYRDTQIDFFKSITASEATAEQARIAYPPDGSRWRPTKREPIGIKDSEHPDSDSPGQTKA